MRSFGSDSGEVVKESSLPLHTKKEREISVTRNYSFWRHPIKWWRDRRKIALLEIFVNHQWENGMREEVFEMNMDVLRYGTAVMDKNGRRVNPENLAPNK